MKKCLFTIHFGGYDAPHEPFKSEGWDYLMFTNRDDIKSDVWDIRVVDDVYLDKDIAVNKEVSPLPNYLLARYYYMQSHFAVPEYDYSLMIGGQVHVLSDINVLDIDYHKDFSMMKHPCRTCIYQEVETIKKENIDKSLNWVSQMERYKSEGFPEKYGLNACGIIGRRKSDFMESFEKEWWHQVMIGSYRDQLSFDYVRWKLGGTVHNFATPYWELLHGEMFSIHKHGTGKKL